MGKSAISVNLPKHPEADNWDGPYFRPFFSEEFTHRKPYPVHQLSLNTLDAEGCWIYTFSGFGIYRCGNQKRVLGPGQVIAFRSPDRGSLHVDVKGLPWHTVNIHVAGEQALAMFDFLINEYGMFHELPQDCAAVELARRIPRLIAKQPYRSAHFWSKVTFEWLNAWWECAQKSCGPLSRVLREAPHTSRLIGLAANNVKSLAEQLGYSRSHLSRKLKWQWHNSPGLVLRNVRMKEAARLLRMSDFSIAEIAGKLGFAAASGLTRAFKKAHGMGPREYREKLKTHRRRRR